MLDSVARMHGGEIFVPKIPSMNIMDVAKVVAPECRTEIIGVRPGEKLHEMLITADDAYHMVEFRDHYVIQPNESLVGSRGIPGSKRGRTGARRLPVQQRFESGVDDARSTGRFAAQGNHRSMIPYGRDHIDEDDVQAVAEVMRGELITQGPQAAAFERLVADYVGARYAVSVANGTAALHLACLALGLGPGDMVLTTPNTFLASANRALYVGARPAFSDIDPETLNLGLQALRDAFRTQAGIKAVIRCTLRDCPATWRLFPRSRARMVHPSSRTHAMRSARITRTAPA